MMLQFRGVLAGVGRKQGPEALAAPRLSSLNILTSVTQRQHHQHV